jgi:hypothetical protein
MPPKAISLTQLAQQIIAAHFAKQSDLQLAIDATVGNGHDTLFLANLGFNKVLGFDVQQVAIAATQAKLLAADLAHVQLLHTGHEEIAKHLSTPANCFMFNFGYLPRGDKSITTNAQSSIAALTAASQATAPKGLISLLCYPGHALGREETTAIEHWLTTLNENWQVDQHQSENANCTTPVLTILRKH